MIRSQCEYRVILTWLFSMKSLASKLSVKTCVDEKRFLLQLRLNYSVS